MVEGFEGVLVVEEGVCSVQSDAVRRERFCDNNEAFMVPQKSSYN